MSNRALLYQASRLRQPSIGRLLDDGGTIGITILNRAIMLLHGNDEVMRRLHRS